MNYIILLDLCKFLSLFIKLKYQRQSPSKSPLNIFAKYANIHGLHPLFKGRLKPLPLEKGKCPQDKGDFVLIFFNYLSLKKCTNRVILNI